MALPDSRDATFVDGGPLPAATVNNIQDMIVGGRHGEIEIFIPGAAALSSDDGTTSGGTRDWKGGIIHINSADDGIFLHFPMIVPVGATITEVKAYLDAASNMQFISSFVETTVPGNSQSVLDDDTTSLSTPTTVTVFSGTHTVLALRTYEVQIEKDTGAGFQARVEAISYKYKN